jgi:NADP-dependent 3-hydroxy acid dehydrogenase YdfG
MCPGSTRLRPTIASLPRAIEEVAVEVTDRTVFMIEAVRIDVTDPGSVLRAHHEVLVADPSLDAVVTTSGLPLTEDLRDLARATVAETTVVTNLLGTSASSTLSPRTCSPPALAPS